MQTENRIIISDSKLHDHRGCELPTSETFWRKRRSKPMCRRLIMRSGWESSHTLRNPRQPNGWISLVQQNSSWLLMELLMEFVKKTKGGMLRRHHSWSGILLWEPHGPTPSCQQDGSLPLHCRWDHDLQRETRENTTQERRKRERRKGKKWRKLHHNAMRRIMENWFNSHVWWHYLFQESFCHSIGLRVSCEYSRVSVSQQDATTPDEEDACEQ